MLILGHIERGHRPGDNDYVLGDGRIVGPFESARARDLFDRWFGSKGERLFSAGEVYEGSVVGDDYSLVRTDEMSLETHPFSSIYDLWLQGDNGQVVFEMPRGFSVVDPRRLVMVDCPEPRKPERKLAAAVSAPAHFDVDRHDKPEYSEKSRHHGEIVVFKEPRGFRYVVGWRHDGRQLKDIVGISLHDHLQTATKAADQRTRDFEPSRVRRKNRPRDDQREALYLWEHSFAADFAWFNDISEAQELAFRICEDIGIRQAKVMLGRSTLISRSYYKSGDVVISGGMLNNHTLIHELAHHLSSWMKLPKEPAHGPNFAGALLALMKEYMGADVDEALERARDRGIVVNLDVLDRVSGAIAKRRSRPAQIATPTV
ncbi:hypothetical protein OIU34_21540 [Pararhizobium sp. BT-229]|uniref:hypothetical protein n=1 Tax=Pararhizobium sp. BT-229 TaxID=2986923 RepID=UPI0021F76492|nr:hypothetical protein [Pararhizobium sp. BT-229]MCV9964477.1 hypothetical protein [Pararhizobium sp. BT-229]